MALDSPTATICTPRQEVTIPTVRVLIVDDQPPYRAIARTLVELTPGFEVVAEADSGEAAVDVAASRLPALILMDINLPGINGIEATRRITCGQPGTVVILLSTYDVDSLPADAIDCGAARYVHKEDLTPELLREVWDGR